MRYEHVCLESIGFQIPGEVVSSAEIESRLAPVYERLKLPPGRLELMTGIAERRFWAPGQGIGALSTASCRQALEAADWDPAHVGALIHGSVCRDYLEPATACAVHHGVGLPEHCAIYDVSNACLGILNGLVQAANMIELGQIDSALVVGSESGRALVETTIDWLNRESSLTRQSIKNSVASLTIGSASCAVLLTRRALSKTQNRLVGGALLARTRFHQLCHSDQDQAGHGMQPLMDTDSEQLMQHGVAAGIDTFRAFLSELNWSPEQLERTYCHQVGAAHRKLLLESLRLDPDCDFVTYPWLGNTGSAALPITLAIGVLCDSPTNARAALLGIGSGINCVMLGVQWRETRVLGRVVDSVSRAFTRSDIPASR